MEHILQYHSPAGEWMEGLPIGNGRLAAMVLSGHQEDKLSLNNEYLYRGLTKNRTVPERASGLPLLRELLKKGEFFEATAYANALYGGHGGVSGLGGRVDAYQPAGDLYCRLEGDSRLISRQLDIQTGIARAVRETGFGSVRSACIAGCASDYFQYEMTGDAPFCATLSFDRTADPDAFYSWSCGDGFLTFSCRFQGGSSYVAKLRLATDGTALYHKESISVKSATYLRAVADVVTEMDRERDFIVDFAQAWQEHTALFQAEMAKLGLELCHEENQKPTDLRIQEYKNGAKDPGIEELYFHYGRYLLVASSLRGRLPANLQGKWNDSITPPWDCDYHFDINLQMNYWMAEKCNMPQCVVPLYTHLLQYMKNSPDAAKKLYGCRGTFLPLQGDAWAVASPEAYGWAVWIGAAPWMAQHLWWHYIYNGDQGFLRDVAYPYFKSVAEFYEDYLIEDQNGVLQIMPSQSPENRFAGTGEFPVSIGISAAMDVQLAYDALSYAVKSSELLQEDQSSREHWSDMLRRLPPFKIGKDGRLLEWDCEREELEPGHRHLSHLYGLFPSDLFTPERNPAQYQAAIRSLKHRLSHGGGHTGWSRAWVACLFARICDGEGFYEHFPALIKDFSTSSLLDLHPPRIFQIDGNLGAVAGVLEALAGFYDQKAHLLKSLPAGWQNGRLSGVKMPGGHLLDFSWENSCVTRLSVTIGFGETLTIEAFAPFTEDVTVTGTPGEIIRVV